MKPLDSPPKSPRARELVLICDPDTEVRRSLARSLLSQGFEVLSAGDAESMRSMLRTAKVDALLFDLGLAYEKGGGASGLLGELSSEHPRLALLALCKLDEEGVKRAAGLPKEVFALIAKPILGDVLVVPLLRRALEFQALLRRSSELSERLSQHEAWGSVIGNSKALLQAHKLALGLAQTERCVLIQGEPGTGKELFARLIHRHSRRASQPLFVLRCDALPEALQEQALFGEKEALSAATLEQAGMWAKAEQATLLLDELWALSPALQARLLGALSGFEDGGQRGSSREKARDVRVIATSSADLSARAADALFRDDLRVRLFAARIVLPPLRQRKDDIPLLAYHFAHQEARSNGRSIRRISVEALRMLRAYAWPGNVRELKAVMEQAALMAGSDVIVPGDLPLAASEIGVSALASPRSMEGALELGYAEAKEQALLDFERGYAEALLAQTDSNMSEAARRAGMDRSNFRRMLKRVRGDAPKAKKAGKL